MKTALAIIKYIFNNDFFQPKIVQYIFKILKERISLTQCFQEEIIETNI